MKSFPSWQLLVLCVWNPFETVLVVVTRRYLPKGKKSEWVRLIFFQILGTFWNVENVTLQWLDTFLFLDMGGGQLDNLVTDLKFYLHFFLCLSLSVYLPNYLSLSVYLSNYLSLSGNSRVSSHIISLYHKQISIIICT